MHNFVLDDKDKKEKQEPGWKYMKDMVRATIVVGSLPELWDAYSWFKDTGIFEILSIKEKLKKDLKNITLVFDFDRKLIGEL